MNTDKIYLIKIGILFNEEDGYEALRDDDVLTIPVSNYLESQKLLFNYIDNYRNYELNKRTIVWLEVYSVVHNAKKAFNRTSYIDGTYIYSYCGITEKEKLISLTYGHKQPEVDTYQDWSRIFHYIPRDKVNEYKQALMEYRLEKNKM